MSTGARHRRRRRARHRVLTNATPGGAGGQLVDLELRHRHAHVQDRIRAGKDLGPRHLPFQQINHNRIWVAIAALAHDPLAWTARLALPAPPGSISPRLRLRILAVAARTARGARLRLLKIDPAWPWAELITTAHARLGALPMP